MIRERTDLPRGREKMERLGGANRRKEVKRQERNRE